MDIVRWLSAYCSHRHFLLVGRAPVGLVVYLSMGLVSARFGGRDSARAQVLGAHPRPGKSRPAIESQGRQNCFL